MRPLIQHLISLGHPIDPDFNIVYIEGASFEDFKPNDDMLDSWNDVRLVLDGEGGILLSAVATTEPGRYYRTNPLNDNGAAVVSFGYHENKWSHGLHRGYPALVQTGTIRITRDRNADGFRTNDKTWDAGAECGLNQHGCNGQNGGNNVGMWSAGCLVGWSWNKHMQFIDLCRKTKKTRFSASLIDGSKYDVWKKANP